MREIVTITSPNAEILRQKAMAVKSVNKQVQALFEEMIQIMDAHKGVGLSAPQIGLSLRLIVAELQSGHGPERQVIALANPVIHGKTTQEEEEDEGCLSLPGVQVKVARPYGILITGLNRHGKLIMREFRSRAARIIQHEIDHLNGMLITDHEPKEVLAGR